MAAGPLSLGFELNAHATKIRARSELASTKDRSEIRETAERVARVL